MLLQLLLQIVGWLAGFFTMALLARVLMQWARAPFRNPLGEFIVAVTDWAVRPARRFIPSAYGLDLPSLLLAWLVQVVFQGLFFALGGIIGLAGIGMLAVVVQMAFIEVLRVGLYLLIGVVLISALFSWINPFAPLAPVFNAIAQPFLRPLQRFIPPIGGVDLSPMALLLILQVLLTLLAALQPFTFH